MDAVQAVCVTQGSKRTSKVLPALNVDPKNRVTKVMASQLTHENKGMSSDGSDERLRFTRKGRGLASSEMRDSVTMGMWRRLLCWNPIIETGSTIGADRLFSLSVSLSLWWVLHWVVGWTFGPRVRH